MNIISVVLQSIYAKRQEDRHVAADRRICTVSRCDEGRTEINTRASMLVTYKELYRQLDVCDILCL